MEIMQSHTVTHWQRGNPKFITGNTQQRESHLAEGKFKEKSLQIPSSSELALYYWSVTGAIAQHSPLILTTLDP